MERTSGKCPENELTVKRASVQFIPKVAASDRDRLYKGGRYGMAQQLRSVEMQELQVFSLGQVCHIVRRAVRMTVGGLL